MDSQVRMPTDHKHGRSHTRPMRNEHVEWAGITNHYFFFNTPEFFEYQNLVVKILFLTINLLNL